MHQPLEDNMNWIWNARPTNETALRLFVEPCAKLGSVFISVAVLQQDSDERRSFKRK